MFTHGHFKIKLTIKTFWVNTINSLTSKINNISIDSQQTN